MAFWSSEKIKSKLEETRLFEPFKSDNIKHGAYELTLGGEIFLTSDKDGTKDEIPENGQVSIEPGHFGILITEEIVRIPSNAIAFISIKASKKFEGLVNVSGFHVDPGFSGKLKFSVFNSGGRPIVIQRKERLFLIWFSDLDRETKDVYDGSHNDQEGIDSNDVRRINADLASPALLLGRIKDLELRFKHGATIVVAVFTLLFGISAKSCINESQSSSASPSRLIELWIPGINQPLSNFDEETTPIDQSSLYLDWDSFSEQTDQATFQTKP